MEKEFYVNFPVSALTQLSKPGMGGRAWAGVGGRPWSRASEVIQEFLVPLVCLGPPVSLVLSCLLFHIFPPISLSFLYLMVLSNVPVISSSLFYMLVCRINTISSNIT